MVLDEHHRDLLGEVEDDVPELAHLRLGETGGGLVENLPRILPIGVVAAIEADRVPVAPVFRWLSTAGPVAPAEMVRTFNCGVGLVLVVSAEGADQVCEGLRTAGETVVTLGRIEAGESGAAPSVRLDAERMFRA